MGAVIESRPTEIVPATEAATILQVIERAATNPSVDIDKMERLLQMHERIVARQAEAEFNESMTLAQSEMRRISTDATNPQTRSRYASYSQLDRHLRTIYARHGFSLSFSTEPANHPDYMRIICIVAKGGFSRLYHIDMPADGKGAKGGDVMTKTHATGAAASYGMRYLLKMIFNVAVGEDDADGNEPVAKTEYITERQVADLDALISEVGANRDAFLKVLKVESLADLPASRYHGAVERLEAKRKGSAP